MNTTRTEACALMYLLMRRNFEFSHHKSFTRVHLQVRLTTIVELARLLLVISLSDQTGPSNDHCGVSTSVVGHFSL